MEEKKTLSESRVESQRGREKLAHKGYLYVFERVNATGKIQFWRCQFKNKGKCRARLWKSVETGEILTTMKGHTHPPDAEEVEVARYRTSIRHRAMKTEDKARDIIESIQKSTSESVRDRLPSSQKLTKMIRCARRNRASTLHHPMKIDNANEVDNAENQTKRKCSAQETKAGPPQIQVRAESEEERDCHQVVGEETIISMLRAVENCPDDEVISISSSSLQEVSPVDVRNCSALSKQWPRVDVSLEDDEALPMDNEVAAEVCIESRRGRQKIAHNGHLYTFDRYSAGGDVEFWRCQKKSTKKCNARLWRSVESGEVLNVVGSHNEPPDDVSVEVERRKTWLKHRAVETRESPEKIILNIRKSTSELVEDALASDKNLLRIIRRARNRAASPRRSVKPESTQKAEVHRTVADPQIKLTTLETERGKPKIAFDGHLYTFERLSANCEIEFWRCQNRSSKKCKARLWKSVETGEPLTIVGTHSEASDPAVVEIIRCKNALKYRAVETRERPEKIIMKIRESSSQPVQDSLANDRTLLKTIRRARHRAASKNRSAIGGTQKKP